jgi:hypothetical protein
METIILIAIVGTLNVVCFFIGAKVGQTVSKGEPIEMPSVNPIEAIREHNDKREADREQDRLETILRNIEKYDGSANGQEEVPRG